MADFYAVHRKQLEAADGRLRRGEAWNVALREPLEICKEPSQHTTLKIVRFIICDGELKPATELDLREIADWNRRHKKTPHEWFGLPSALIGAS